MKKLRASLGAAALTAAVCACLGGSASALVNPSVDTTYADPRLGAHSDVTLRLDFDYGATGMVTANIAGSAGTAEVQDPVTYPDTTDYRETIRDVVVDIPPGLVGNPQAIPFADRCSMDVFLNGNCPETSIVGTARVFITQIPQTYEEAEAVGAQDEWIEPMVGDPYNMFRILPQATYNTASTGPYTRLALLQSDPELPAKIGLMVQPPLNAFKRFHQLLSIEPDSGSDLRLRTESLDIPNQLFSKSTDEHVGNVRIDALEIKLLGALPNGKSFMTNPIACEPWTTNIWAKTRFSNVNADADPLRTGTNDYKLGTPGSTQPDCSNAGEIPFNAKGKVSISSNARDVSPDFDFDLEFPGMYDDGQVASGPKKIVARVPAAINVDVQQLGRTCARDDFMADRCPASTKVGYVNISTPLLNTPITGDTYLVKQIVGAGGLPDLGLRLRGPIDFVQLGTNRYVGVRGNEIETTFDNIPQIGFTKLNFHLYGGANGLLRTLACPTSNKQPVPGAFSLAFTSFTGATADSTTMLNAASCFGIQTLKKFSCVYRQLRIQPTYTSRARIKRAEFRVGGKKIQTQRKVPFQFRIPARKFKVKGRKYKFEIRAVYDDGTVSKKQSSFKRC